MCGYVRKFPQGAIRFRIGIPDHEAIFGAAPIKYDWMETVYCNPIEELLKNAPVTKGNPVCSTTYALLVSCISSTRPPFTLFSKQQNQVESVTYGSEFMAARQAVQQIIDLCYTLCMFSVPVHGASWLLGDNKSVVTSSTIPHSSLSKCWNALSYHKVREAVAGGFIQFEHISTNQNPADILMKSLPWHRHGYMLNHCYFGRVKPPLILVWPHQRGVTNWSDVGQSPSRRFQIYQGKALAIMYWDLTTELTNQNKAKYNLHHRNTTTTKVDNHSFILFLIILLSV